MTTPAPQWVFTTPKTCHGCGRTVFQLDELNECPGCVKRRHEAVRDEEASLRGPELNVTWIDEIHDFQKGKP